MSSRVTAESYFGSPQSNISPVDCPPGAEAAGRFNTAAYTGRDKRCMGKDNTCMGFKMKTSILCYGCVQKQEKALRTITPPPIEVVRDGL